MKQLCRLEKIMAFGGVFNSVCEISRKYAKQRFRYVNIEMILEKRPRLRIMNLQRIHTKQRKWMGVKE